MFLIRKVTNNCFWRSTLWSRN